MNWNSIPIIRIIIPFLSGILTVILFDFNYSFPLAVFFVLLAVYLIYLIFLQKKITYKYRWIGGIIIVSFFFFSGYELTVLKKPTHQPTHFSHAVLDKNYFVCRLTEPVQIKQNSCKAIVEIFQIKDSGKWVNSTGKAILYLQKDSSSENLKYGDRLIIASKLAQPDEPLNPAEFNYKKYLKNKFIEFQCYANSKQWKKIGSGDVNWLRKFAYQSQMILIGILQKANLTSDESGVINALLIGNTDNLDAEVIKDYRNSGAMHILSVSGMHVGVIYLILSYLLFFLKKTRTGTYLRAVLLILLVWTYAVITGLSPSVLRAATMFSLIAAGQTFKVVPNTYNTLAASAFILLSFNPYMINDIGFQLSYLAVIGIVYIYPVIYRAVLIKNKYLDKLWSLIAVSVAAQLITAPISLLYFHQFPNYFILTNIVAVPLSGLVIYLGVAYLIFYAVPYLSLILSKALLYTLTALNKSISFIDNLPYSVTHGIDINWFETLLAYLILFSVMLFFTLKKQKYLLNSLVLILVLVVSLNYRSIIAINTSSITIYNISKHTAIDFKSERRCFSVTDTALTSKISKLDFHTLNNRIKNDIEELQYYSILQNVKEGNDVFYKNERFIQFKNSRLVIIDRNEHNSGKIRVDYVIISNNPEIDLVEINEKFNPKLIVFDASNNKHHIEKWIHICKKHSLNYHNTRTSGACIIKL